MRLTLFRCFAVAVLLIGAARAAVALEPSSFADPHTIVLASPHDFASLQTRLETAVAANGFFVVSRASASAGAAGRGVVIPGNLVVGVFRNDYAVRMLDASLASGIEAPLRFYITENNDGTATLSYRLPTRIFAPYGVPALTEMSGELDPVWARIAAAAVAP